VPGRLPHARGARGRARLPARARQEEDLTRASPCRSRRTLRSSPCRALARVAPLARQPPNQRRPIAAPQPAWALAGGGAHTPRDRAAPGSYSRGRPARAGLGPAGR
jgi:hypothetical protein